nr:immunoglobulin heavy chain junction region [Macaca mulatta]MOW99122.1 immunoglobulin heavy chain junction region [Macaca mulatta]MOW99372.1 immunoglobulin heavy chain junction region [Macaca mulatta]MOW99632.1 immunoglobulin heavy chain junction region [Macaca mulatta]MOW99686.1 immunoglobulin heavy chain junction region [Macaca mulatta]
CARTAWGGNFVGPYDHW